MYEADLYCPADVSIMFDIDEMKEEDAEKTENNQLLNLLEKEGYSGEMENNAIEKYR